MCCCKLSDSQVFIAYAPTGAGNTNYDLYGIVLSINNTSISTGTRTQLSGLASAGAWIDVVALSSTKVVVAHSMYSSCQLALMVCNISGTSISTGKDTEIGNGYYQRAIELSMTKLDSSHVFILGNRGSTGRVCEISGTTITKGVETNILSSNGSYGDVLFDKTNKIIAFSYCDGKIIETVCTISGTTITIQSSNTIDTSTGNVTSLCAEKIDEDKYIVGYQCDGELVVLKCNQSSLISKTIPSSLSGKNAGKSLDIINLDGNNFCIIHQLNEDNNIAITKWDFNNETQPSTVLISSAVNTGNVLSSFLLNDNSIFIAHPKGEDYLYGTVIQISLENKAKAVKTKNETINGVAITSGQDGEIVQIKVPGEE